MLKRRRPEICPKVSNVAETAESNPLAPPPGYTRTRLQCPDLSVLHRDRTSGAQPISRTNWMRTGSGRVAVSCRRSALVGMRGIVHAWSVGTAQDILLIGKRIRTLGSLGETLRDVGAGAWCGGVVVWLLCCATRFNVFEPFPTILHVHINTCRWKRRRASRLNVSNSYGLILVIVVARWCGGDLMTREGRGKAKPSGVVQPSQGNELTTPRTREQRPALK